MIDLIVLFIFIAGLILVVMSLIGKINISLLFLVPLLPLQNIVERLHGYPMGKDFIDIVLIAMILGWVFKSISTKDNIFEPTPLNKILIILAIFTYFSLWRGSSYLGFSAPISPGDARLQSWKNYMIFPLLYFIVVNNVKNTKGIKRLVIAMVFAMLVMDFYTVRQIRLHSALASREKIMGTFVWTGVNVIAAFYAQYIFVLLGIFIMCKEKFYRLLFGPLIVIGLYIVLFLYSRGAYIAGIIGFLIIGLLKKKILIIPLLFILLFWQSILPSSVIERINYTLTEEGGLDSSTQGRLDMWKKSMELFKKSPIFGVGFNTFYYLGFSFGDTHNIYFETLAEQGLIGLTILLILFFFSLKYSYRLYKNATDNFLRGLGLGFLACVIATMTTNMFGDRWTYLQIGAYYWVFLALVVRGNIISEEEMKLQEEIIH